MHTVEFTSKLRKMVGGDNTKIRENFPQSQASTTDQLEKLIEAGNVLGLYDATDFLRRMMHQFGE